MKSDFKNNHFLFLLSSSLFTKFDPMLFDKSSFLLPGILLILSYLQHHVVSRSQLQLVGVSAMLLASKYEETYAPEIADFVYITDNSYSKGQIKKMEQLILKTISYDISNPLCLHFLRRNSKAAVVRKILLRPISIRVNCSDWYMRLPENYWKIDHRLFLACETMKIEMEIENLK